MTERTFDKLDLDGSLEIGDHPEFAERKYHFIFLLQTFTSFSRYM